MSNKQYYCHAVNFIWTGWVYIMSKVEVKAMSFLFLYNALFRELQ